MQTIGILGYGRFGKVLAKLLKDTYHIKAYDPKKIDDPVVEFVSEKELLLETTLFIAVPIHTFESCIQSIAPRLAPNTTVFDVCSIKLHPVEVMEKYLPDPIGIIATHPLFGPDSIDSEERLNFMMYPVRDTQDCYLYWQQFFSKKFNIVEITPDEHDKLAAESQGVVHFIARFLQEAHLHKTAIDTLGFKQLLRLIENNCKDSWALFSDLQNYNPYSKEMLDRLEKAFHTVKSSLSEV